MSKAMLSLMMALLISEMSFAAQLESHIPVSGIENFVAENLDLSTFRNSTGPRRTAKTRTFASLGMSPSMAQNGNLQYDTADWFYGVEIKKRKDFNGDGIEDLALCFTDKAKNGTYSTKNSLLATRYSDEGLIVVLGYEIDACKN